MAAPRDREPREGSETERPGRMGEGYFILGMAVQVGLVGLVGLALVGVEGLGFISLGTAIALAGLAIGILAVGTILTLASLRHTLNVVYDQGNRLDRLAERVGRLADDLRGGDERVGWAGGEEMDLQEAERHAAETRARQDPRDRRPEPGPGSPPDPLEEEPVHPVADLPGIDDDQAQSLRDMEIEDTSQLRSANAMYVAGRLETEPETVRYWQSTAELMAVEGVDAEAAQMLTQAGITSIRELGHESPERLMNRIEEADVGPEAPPVGPQQADAWIEAARERIADRAETSGEAEA